MRKADTGNAFESEKTLKIAAFLQAFAENFSAEYHCQNVYILTAIKTLIFIGKSPYIV